MNTVVVPNVVIAAVVEPEVKRDASLPVIKRDASLPVIVASSLQPEIKRNSSLPMSPVTMLHASSDPNVWGIAYLANNTDADPCPPQFRQIFDHINKKAEQVRQSSVAGGISSRVCSCLERTRRSNCLTTCFANCTSPCYDPMERTMCGITSGDCNTMCAIGAGAGVAVATMDYNLGMETAGIVGTLTCCTQMWQWCATRSNAQEDSIAANSAILETDRELLSVENLCRETMEGLAQKFVRIFVHSTTRHKDIIKARSASREMPQIQLNHSDKHIDTAARVYDCAVKILARSNEFIEKMKLRTPRPVATMTPLLDAAYLIKRKFEEQNEADEKGRAEDLDNAMDELDGLEEIFPSWEASRIELGTNIKANTQIGYYKHLRKEQFRHLEHEHQIELGRKKTQELHTEIESVRDAARADIAAAKESVQKAKDEMEAQLRQDREKTAVLIRDIRNDHNREIQQLNERISEQDNMVQELNRLLKIQNSILDAHANANNITQDNILKITDHVNVAKESILQLSKRTEEVAAQAKHATTTALQVRSEMGDRRLEVLKAATELTLKGSTKGSPASKYPGIPRRTAGSSSGH